MLGIVLELLSLVVELAICNPSRFFDPLPAFLRGHLEFDGEADGSGFPGHAFELAFEPES
jgi:hypothetical protein